MRKGLDKRLKIAYVGQMEIERIIGSLFSGFMCKVYAAGFAVWIAYEAGSFIIDAFGAVSKGFVQ